MPDRVATGEESWPTSRGEWRNSFALTATMFVSRLRLGSPCTLNGCWRRLFGALVISVVKSIPVASTTRTVRRPPSPTPNSALKNPATVMPGLRASGEAHVATLERRDFRWPAGAGRHGDERARYSAELCLNERPLHERRSIGGLRIREQIVEVRACRVESAQIERQIPGIPLNIRGLVEEGDQVADLGRIEGIGRRSRSSLVSVLDQPTVEVANGVVDRRTIGHVVEAVPSLTVSVKPMLDQRRRIVITEARRSACSLRRMRGCAPWCLLRRCGTSGE